VGKKTTLYRSCELRSVGILRSRSEVEAVGGSCRRPEKCDGVVTGSFCRGVFVLFGSVCRVFFTMSFYITFKFVSVGDSILNNQ
jgi:hypothetical protein